MKQLGILLLCLFLLSCNLASSPEDMDKIRIEDILKGIARDFCWKDIEGIMKRVHPDYYHKGMYGFQLRGLWQDRMARFDLLDVEVQDIDLAGSRATVSMKLTFTAADSTLSYLEPDTGGDASYFYREDGVWFLCGNQQNMK
ncbi:MAG TPA: hypothetical protein PK802_05855 [Candidatus Cloacimonadota bacterium]|jgi:hypothetical protein|nr:hypothetical protein [Candidatus Cloacimonadota bacterium]HOR59238.1 hypothetical protein [Candidatus Cloacimonadota bacterium]HPB09193.1 hypothetical protein [Candidatus Cloacimonadota bacterium]HPL23459.1 hypothetical protein [Candidatus Cloacimonadota bacterium]HQP18120.1 hypothetical protein [Candidatus Cloacimonadota bacterium]